MEADLRARLLANGAVAALVGTRCAWGERPGANALPSLTLTAITPGRGYTHQGADALHGAGVQVDCWAASHLAASQLRDAVIAAIEPKDVTVGATLFGPAFLEADRDAEPEDLDGGVRIFRRILEFTIWHAPAA
jgi:hypothetical protein